DGFNINDKVGATQPEQLAQTVASLGVDLGIALDGDGDRVIMADHKGELVDGDELLYILAAQRHNEQNLGGGVVGTQMSNFGLEEALRCKNIDFVRASVGDRYVLAELQARQWLLGGESSGHLLCLDLTSTGDGIISALQVLVVMLTTGRSLNDLKQDMTKYPQHTINIRCHPGAKPTSPTLTKAITAAETKLKGQGRVLLRPSGTEPVIRITVEGEDPTEVQTLSKDLAAVVTKELG
ncbi:MAG: phosphoglucosamine mutase, partial [Pseudomonadales bacterium]